MAGHASIKMTDLKQVFEAAGCKEVRTVIQSGNVLFEAEEGETSRIIQRVQSKLSALFGSKATILFRTLQEVERLVRADPVKRLSARPDVKLYVSFLSEKPPRKPKLPLASAKESLEVMRITEREVFVVSRKKKNGCLVFRTASLKPRSGFRQRPGTGTR